MTNLLPSFQFQILTKFTHSFRRPNSAFKKILTKKRYATQPKKKLSHITGRPPLKAFKFGTEKEKVSNHIFKDILNNFDI